MILTFDLHSKSTFRKQTNKQTKPQAKQNNSGNMNVSEQDLCLSKCVREIICLYDKTIPDYHQRDVIANCWEEMAYFKSHKKSIIILMAVANKTLRLLRILHKTLSRPSF